MRELQLTPFRSTQSNIWNDLRTTDEATITLTPSLISAFIEFDLMFSIFFKGITKFELDSFKRLLGLPDYGYIITIKLSSVDSNSSVINTIDELALYKAIKESIPEDIPSCIGPLLTNRIIILVTTSQLPSSQEVFKSNSNELVIRIKERIKTEMSYRCNFGIGTPVELSNIYSSYLESLYAVQILSPNTIVHTTDVYEISTNHIHDFDQYEKSLIEAIHYSKDEDASFYFTAIMDSLSSFNSRAKRNKILEVLISVTKTISVDFQSGASHVDILELAENLLVVPDEKLIEWSYQRFSQITKIVKSKSVTDFSNRIVIATKNYLDANYKENITLEEAAAQVNISPQYFSKVIKKSTGFNFVDWLSLIRIKKAKELLMSPHTTVKEVCFLVGYRDPNYFSRIFKRRVGFTPSEYQKMITGSIN